MCVCVCVIMEMCVCKCVINHTIYDLQKYISPNEVVAFPYILFAVMVYIYFWWSKIPS